MDLGIHRLKLCKRWKLAGLSRFYAIQSLLELLCVFVALMINFFSGKNNTLNKKILYRRESTVQEKLSLNFFL